MGFRGYDQPDYQKLYVEFHPRILRYLTGLVGEFEAEDLTQEVFVRINQALLTFRGESRLSTWIYRIATNTAFDRLRQSSYQHSANQSLPDDPDSGEQVVDQDIWTGEPAPSPEQLLYLKQRFECYCDFIEMLPENYRLVVALSQLEDFTTKEIADILGLNVDVVKIRLHRGRVRLLEELKALNLKIGCRRGNNCGAIQGADTEWQHGLALSFSSPGIKATV